MIDYIKSRKQFLIIWFCKKKSGRVNTKIIIIFRLEYIIFPLLRNHVWLNTLSLVFLPEHKSKLLLQIGLLLSSLTCFSCIFLIHSFIIHILCIIMMKQYLVRMETDIHASSESVNTLLSMSLCGQDEQWPSSHSCYSFIHHNITPKTLDQEEMVASKPQQLDIPPLPRRQRVADASSNS